MLRAVLLAFFVNSALGGSSNNVPSLDKPFQSSFEHLPHVPCVSLFHRNGRVGCGTLGRSTMTGRLLHWSTVVSSEDGSNSVANVPPYVVVIDERDYSNDNVDKIVSYAVSATEVGGSKYDDENKAGAGVLRGILVLNSTAVDEVSSSKRRLDGDESYYSPEPQTPQGENTPSEQISVGINHAWNSNGDGLTNRDMYGIPTAYIADSSVASYLYSVSLEQSKTLVKKSQHGKLDEDDIFPAIVAEYDYYMGPDNQNAKTCLSWVDKDDVWRPKCLPLGGNSVWGVAGSDTEQNEDGGDDENAKPIVMLATSIDSTSMFHDASPGANTAASNIIALLMAAKLIGTSVPVSTIDGLSKRIAFGFFQGESYGFVGSRSFLRDVAYPGFECDEDSEVPAVAKNTNGERACLYPLRPTLSFRGVKNIVGMISVDQVGVLQTEKNLYVHGGGNVVQNDDGTSAFLAEVLAGLSTDDYTVSASAEQGDDDGNNDDEYPLPPSPLTSLVKLSEGAVGGAVLAGYDQTFAEKSFYHSHLDSNKTTPVSMESIAASATILARAAVASAYDNGDLDAETSAAYATNLIPDLDPTDESLMELANCLLTDGNCDLLLKHGKTEQQNSKQRTGVDLGLGVALGTPPNYYISVYDATNGQSFVQIGNAWYGAYTKDDKKYGEKNTDTFLVRASLLETGIYGLLNNYLGQGDAASEMEEADRTMMETSSLLTCSSTKDCSKASYCTVSSSDEDGSSSSSAVCAGNVCVCPRSHYHLALDESIEAVPNNSTGRYRVKDDDEGVSAMYTEPYWSSTVGVRVYRDAGDRTGTWALGAGLVVAIVAFASTWSLKNKLKKEKLY